NSNVKSPGRPSLTRLAMAVALAGFSVVAQAGKITSIPSASGADGFGGLNLDNVTVILNGVQGAIGQVNTSWFDPSDGAYSFASDSDFTYLGEVDDGAASVMGYTLAKDWPVGEPSGIKIVNDDFDVKEGKPTNCVMSTSYLADHFLDSADPKQVPCSGPFQSHKRYKLAMLPSTIADGAGFEKGIDLVFNVEADGIERNYQIFQKINNWTGKRLQGFTVQVGTGIGADFVPAATDITGVGVTNLSLSVPDTIWKFNQLANFSSGLFGPIDTSHDRPAGYFDPLKPAGFEINEYPNASGATDTLTATTTLGSSYVDTPPGAAAASAISVPSPDANQFGPWLSNNMLPFGIFFDDDNNPETDAELQAWYGYNPTLDKLGWMTGAAEGFIEVSDIDINAKSEDLAMSMGVIDDLVNVGLNYVVTVVDVTGFPGYNADPALNAATFTIRITPAKEDIETPVPSYVGALPNPSMKFISTDAVVALDPAPFNIGGLITARVGDADGDTTGDVDFVDVTITSSDTSIPPLVLQLEEQGTSRGVFAAVLPEVYSDVAVGADVTITMEYNDVVNTSGFPIVRTAITSTEVALPAGALQFNPATY
ncbi:MAG: choice-of-anchor F family protein, partial [Gammaproteobacteria bacterium]|nr:choice-of-anchor F family protein [Gammaproteobacteria bacterium]